MRLQLAVDGSVALPEIRVGAAIVELVDVDRDDTRRALQDGIDVTEVNRTCKRLRLEGQSLRQRGASGGENFVGNVGFRHAEQRADGNRDPPYIVDQKGA